MSNYLPKGQKPQRGVPGDPWVPEHSDSAKANESTGGGL